MISQFTVEINAIYHVRHIWSHDCKNHEENCSAYMLHDHNLENS